MACDENHCLTLSICFYLSIQLDRVKYRGGICALEAAKAGGTNLGAGAAGRAEGKLTSTGSEAGTQAASELISQPALIQGSQGGELGNEG